MEAQEISALANVPPQAEAKEIVATQMRGGTLSVQLAELRATEARLQTVSRALSAAYSLAEVPPFLHASIAAVLFVLVFAVCSESAIRQLITGLPDAAVSVGRVIVAFTASFMVASLLHFRNHQLSIRHRRDRMTLEDLSKDLAGLELAGRRLLESRDARRIELGNNEHVLHSKIEP